MPRPPPKSALPWPKRLWLTIITPVATRTLGDCQPSGIGTVASSSGRFGSRTSMIDVPLGFFMWPTKSVVPSTQTCPPPGTSMWATCFVLRACISSSASKNGDCHQLNETLDVAVGGAAPALVQPERAQRRLVAGDEQHYRRARFVDVLIPLARPG